MMQVYFHYLYYDCTYDAYTFSNNDKTMNDTFCM